MVDPHVVDVAEIIRRAFAGKVQAQELTVSERHMQRRSERARVHALRRGHQLRFNPVTHAVLDSGQPLGCAERFTVSVESAAQLLQHRPQRRRDCRLGGAQRCDRQDDDQSGKRPHGDRSPVTER